jgi:glycosyltransferase involved in cell wall biosynthesis
MTKVSVIVPVYNEVGTIRELLSAVNAQKIPGISFEVIVIDDGSSDGTDRILKDNPALYSTLVSLERNQGKGGAVIAGLKVATGDYILFQDADLEYDPSDYAALLSPVLRFNADVVMGSRLVAPQVTRVSYFWHRVGNRFITLMFNLFNNTTFTDIYSCYLLYRQDLVDVRALRTRGWQQHAEILTLAVREAKRVYEVPISYFGRSYEDGKKIRARHAIGVIQTIVGTRFRSHHGPQLTFRERL